MAKHLTLTMRRLVNTTGTFYRILGPYLSRREIVKEVGGPIWDDDEKRWYVALDGTAVAGFCAARYRGKYVAFQSAYTLPDYRRRGVYRTLTLERMKDWSEGHELRSVCTEASLPLLLSYGFTATRVKGSFTEVVRHAS